jgi:hypothetical protein
MRIALRWDPPSLPPWPQSPTLRKVPIKPVPIPRPHPLPHVPWRPAATARRAAASRPRGSPVSRRRRAPMAHHSVGSDSSSYPTS